MKFKVGQIVEVVNNSSMCVSIDATAVVTKANHDFMGYDLIDVAWKTNSGNQMNGGYPSYYFKLKSVRGEQLMFAFMQTSD